GGGGGGGAGSGEGPRALRRARCAARQPVTCVVAAPDGLMRVDGDNPASDLVIEVRRAEPREPAEPGLPPPLADTLLDLRVDTATPLAHEVKAGQYIQGLHVEGREWPGFLGVNARRLADGGGRGRGAATTPKR